MGMFLSACFPKFLAKERSFSTNIDESLELLRSATANLKKLEYSLSNGTISLKWCCEAINFLKIMHSNFFLLMEKSEILRSWEGVTFLDSYMEESLSLMDLCNWLKIAIFGMDRYRLIVEFAVKMLCEHQEPRDARIKFELERLEKERQKLYGVERWNDIINFSKICSPKTKARDRNLRVFYAVKAIMAVIYMLIFCVIFHPVSVKLEHQEFDQLLRVESTYASLQKLVSVLSKGLDEMKNDSRPILVEYKKIEREVLDLRADVLKGDACVDKDKLKKSIDLLQSSSTALRDGLQLFDSAVNSLFEEVITDRNKLLALFNFGTNRTH